MEIIKRVIEKYFDFMDEIGENSFIEEFIPKELINLQKEPKYEGTRFWKPIKSIITDNQIKELEKYYGYKLPNAYKFFVQYRHFMELNLGQYSISFFKNLPETFIEDTKKEIESFYGNLIERKYLPFARMSDYGMLCFKADESETNHNYKIVSFNHEDDYSKPEPYSENFESMFIEFENHLNEWIKNKRKNTI